MSTAHFSTTPLAAGWALRASWTDLSCSRDAPYSGETAYRFSSSRAALTRAACLGCAAIKRAGVGDMIQVVLGRVRLSEVLDAPLVTLASLYTPTNIHAGDT